MENVSPAAPSLLPGQQPPLFIITPTDQAGTVVIVTGICLVVAVVSVLIRAYFIIQIGESRVNWDDGAIVAALLFAIIQSSLVQREAHTGLGRTIQQITSQQAQKIQQTQFADQIFYILSVWLSKLSVALFLLRLSPRRSDRRMSQGAMIVIGTTCITAIAAVSFVCKISEPWQYFTVDGVTCTTPYDRWIAASIMDILSEAVLAAIAFRIIWSLQMRSSKRIVVAFSFLQRLAIIAPIIARLHFLSRSYHTEDPTLHATFSTICKESEVAFAIVAASVPFVGPFLNATATHYGAPPEAVGSGRDEYTNSASSSKLRSTQGPRSIRLERLNPGKKIRLSDSDGAPIEQNALTRNHSTVTVSSNKSSDDRTGLIRKVVSYDVRYYERETG